MQTCTNISTAALHTPREERDWGLEADWWWIITLTAQMSSKKMLKLTSMQHYQTLTNLVIDSLKSKRQTCFSNKKESFTQPGQVWRSVKGDCSDGRRTLPVAVQQRSSWQSWRPDRVGGFVCVWIRIGEVLFYGFSVTAQEKGKRCRDGRVQTGWRWKPWLCRALFHSVIAGLFERLNSSYGPLQKCASQKQA